MVKKVALVVFFLFFLALLLCIGGLIWWRGVVQAPGNNSASKRFSITQGTSAQKIGDDLEKAGLVKSAFAFKLYLQMKNLTKSIPTGEFLIPGNLSLYELVDKLLEGPTELWVTIPEGLRREQIPSRFISALSLTDSEASNFEQEFLDSSKRQEGFLFPDTYLFARDVSGKVAVEKMRKTFDSKFTDQFANEISNSALNLIEIVTLASILERETLTSEERPIVAGILLKRLEAGWPLQADATVQYAVASSKCKSQNTKCEWWLSTLSREDLEINSAYNTYKYPGLPPGPIANPGLTSLKAVVAYKDTDYWYYIHDLQGVIHYAETLEEHNANIAKYLGK